MPIRAARASKRPQREVCKPAEVCPKPGSAYKKKYFPDLEEREKDGEGAPAAQARGQDSAPRQLLRSLL